MQEVRVTATELKLGDLVDVEENIEIVGVIPTESGDGHWVYWGQGENAWDSQFLPVGETIEVTR